jgi:hypothetical protein
MSQTSNQLEAGSKQSIEEEVKEVTSKNEAEDFTLKSKLSNWQEAELKMETVVLPKHQTMQCHIVFTVTAVKSSKSDSVPSVFTKFSKFGLEAST